MEGSYTKKWLDNHIACEECDILVELPTLCEGQQGRCPRCDFELIASPHDGFKRPMAYAIAAAILMSIANSYSFLTFKSGGFENVISLPQSAIALYENGSPELAFIVLTFIIIVPIVLVLMSLFLLISLTKQKYSIILKPLTRFLFILKSWNMAEVFLISVVVSLVKLGNMATVVLGTSFYAYIAFSLCLIGVLGNLNKVVIWRSIDKCSP